MKTIPTYLRHKLLLARLLCVSLALCLLFSVQAFALEGDEGTDNDTLVGFVNLDVQSDLDDDQADTPTNPIVTNSDVPSNPIDPTNPVDPTNPETDVYYFDNYETHLNWVDSNVSGPMYAIWRSVDNEECFDHFVALLIDGVELERDVDYKASIWNTTQLVDGEVVFHDEGTLITLYATPLQAIGAGEHTITALFDDGSFSIPLTIFAYEDWIAQFGEFGQSMGGLNTGEENASPEAATETTNPTPQAGAPANTTTQAPAQNLPATADASSSASALLLTSLAILACAAMLHKHNVRNML